MKIIDMQKRLVVTEGKSALLHSDIIDFAVLPTQRPLGGKSFIVKCHVTWKKANERVSCCWGNKFLLYNNNF